MTGILMKDSEECDSGKMEPDVGTLHRQTKMSKDGRSSLKLGESVESILPPSL